MANNLLSLESIWMLKILMEWLFMILNGKENFTWLATKDNAKLFNTLKSINLKLLVSIWMLFLKVLNYLENVFWHRFWHVKKFAHLYLRYSVQEQLDNNLVSISTSARNCSLAMIISGIQINFVWTDQEQLDNMLVSIETSQIKCSYSW